MSTAPSSAGGTLTVNVARPVTAASSVVVVPVIAGVGAVVDVGREHRAAVRRRRAHDPLHRAPQVVARHRHVHLDRDVTTQVREVGAGEIGSRRAHRRPSRRLSPSCPVQSPRCPHRSGSRRRCRRVPRSRRSHRSPRIVVVIAAAGGEHDGHDGAEGHRSNPARAAPPGARMTGGCAVCDWSPHGTSTCREPHWFPCHTRFSVRHQRDILDEYAESKQPTRYPSVEVVVGLVVEDRASGFCGDVVRWNAEAVTLRDRRQHLRHFTWKPGGFLLEGRPVTLVRPAAHPVVRQTITASGSIAGDAAGRQGRRRQPDLGRGPPRRRAGRARVG